ncbi:hypothetical protein ECG_07291 [Echinococcus granulosus]|uniref:Uncharacterized protein n=1 Tax=Echinococcus granulosus TaxID=6210 RepID=A0A068WQ82_ECHGR|nr:hypothetical protein ECG_07291 [Echinococcus granulosus]CDS21962.1 hypothetical protein EgrG_002023700 [Echinococcus granulosus]
MEPEEVTNVDGDGDERVHDECIDFWCQLQFALLDTEEADFASAQLLEQKQPLVVSSLKFQVINGGVECAWCEKSSVGWHNIQGGANLDSCCGGGKVVKTTVTR